MNPKEFPCFFKFLAIILLLCPILLTGQQLLEPPKPTHSDKGIPHAKLTVVHEIQSDFDKDLFFAEPFALKTSPHYIYIFDTKLMKVFVFDNKYRFIGQFLEKGQGPGEVFPNFPLNKGFYASWDDSFYLHDAMADKLVHFSPTGKLLKDTRLNRRFVSVEAFNPVVDKDGFLYSGSLNGGIVDKLDQDMKVVHTFLDMNLNDCYLLYRPQQDEKQKNSESKEFRLRPSISNTLYDFTSDGHLLIYLFRPSTAYIFKDQKLVRQFDIIPQELLPIYKKRLERSYKIGNSNTLGKGIKAIKLFSSGFVDRDEPYFYLHFITEDKSNCLYMFDLKGKLVQIISKTEHIAKLRAKRNNLFYGLSAVDGHPVILKKEEIIEPQRSQRTQSPLRGD